MDPLLEQGAVEGLRMAPKGLGLELLAARLEAADRLDKPLHGLMLEEETGRRFAPPRRHDRLERSPLPEGDDRPARGHGLDRRGAKALQRGEKPRATGSMRTGHAAREPKYSS